MRLQEDILVGEERALLQEFDTLMTGGANAIQEQCDCEATLFPEEVSKDPEKDGDESPEVKKPNRGVRDFSFPSPETQSPNNMRTESMLLWFKAIKTRWGRLLEDKARQEIGVSFIYRAFALFEVN